MECELEAVAQLDQKAKNPPKTSALFVTSKIEFSNPPILEFKVLQNAFKIKKNRA